MKMQGFLNYPSRERCLLLNRVLKSSSESQDQGLNLPPYTTGLYLIQTQAFTGDSEEGYEYDVPVSYPAQNYMNLPAGEKTLIHTVKLQTATQDQSLRLILGDYYQPYYYHSWNNVSTSSFEEDYSPLLQDRDAFIRSNVENTLFNLEGSVFLSDMRIQNEKIIPLSTRVCNKYSSSYSGYSNQIQPIVTATPFDVNFLEIRNYNIMPTKTMSPRYDIILFASIKRIEDENNLQVYNIYVTYFPLNPLFSPLV